MIFGFLFLQSRLKNKYQELPVFLRIDTIAKSHQTKINTTISSYYKPTNFQLQQFENDYSAIWSHLNYVYNTGDVEKGKEYFTEDWFKMINLEYKNKFNLEIIRSDELHNVHIVNWSFDGLVCNVIDSNIVIKFYNKQELFDSTKANIAMALLFQGDHWRIEAMKYLN